MGYNSHSTTRFSVAIGTNSISSGASAIALGYRTTASGDYSAALGYKSKATGSYTTALGYNCNAAAEFSFAAGLSSTTNGYASVALGAGCQTYASKAVAMGESCISSGYTSFAMGQNNETTGDNSVVFGLYSTATGEGSYLFGRYNEDNGLAGSYIFNTTASKIPVTPSLAYQMNFKADNGFRFFAAATPLESNSMVIEAGGNVGIGIDNPDEKLHIVGNLKISGEVNVSNSGSANMIPVAYGNINTTGSINTSSGNISVTRTTTGTYQIAITGEYYTYLNYITNVSIVTGGVLIPNIGSVSGKIVVRIYDTSGTLTDAIFSFVTYRP